jgi:hypothetical protein
MPERRDAFVNRGESGRIGEDLTPRLAPRTDLTVQAAADDELRRRAAEGDERAPAELARRGSMLLENTAARNRRQITRDRVAGRKMPTATPSLGVPVSRGGKRDRSKFGDQSRVRATVTLA